jgi:hypothetical protein
MFSTGVPQARNKPTSNRIARCTHHEGIVLVAFLTAKVLPFHLLEDQLSLDT